MTVTPDSCTVPVPSPGAVSDYLTAAGLTYPSDAVADALKAEKAAQRRRCRVPDPSATEWPADLAEALYRRVAHNLALRPLALGVQASMSEAAVATTRVGGTDAEVRRLEAPFRKLSCG